MNYFRRKVIIMITSLTIKYANDTVDDGTLKAVQTPHELRPLQIKSKFAIT